MSTSFVNVDQRRIISSLVVLMISLFSIFIALSDLQFSNLPEASFSTCLLIREKNFSIGANSGEYAGKNKTRSPSSMYSFFICFDLWMAALSKMINTLSSGTLSLFITNSFRLLIKPPNILELIVSADHQDKIDPFEVMAEIIDMELENPILLIVSSSPFRIQEYSIFISLENDDSSIFIRSSDVFIAVQSWIQNRDLIYAYLFWSNLTGLDFPFLYDKPRFFLKYFLTKCGETCIPVLFVYICTGITYCFSIRMLLNILLK